MHRPLILAAALASATAFAPTVGVAPRLRSAPATNVQMAIQPEGKVSPPAPWPDLRCLLGLRLPATACDRLRLVLSTASQTARCRARGFCRDWQLQLLLQAWL